MISRTRALWDTLRSSLWFTPGILAGIAIAAAWSVLRLDRRIADTDLAGIAWAFSGGPESARQLLATLAGSMMTLTGVTFSITLAALALAAGQYSPRILRNFMRDRLNQTVLGVFIGTFLYCILVLRSIRSGDEAWVPAVGVTGAILLSIVSLGFFIIFIHHIARSIQVSSMIGAVSHETHAAIDGLFTKGQGAAGPARILAAAPVVEDGDTIRADRDGYVERIDTAGLCEAARRAGVSLDLPVAPGDFVGLHAPIALVRGSPAQRARLEKAVRSALFLGRQRTLAEDPAFGFRQLVDIGVRALSPGINDPTTACNAVDFLGSLLADMADRPWPATTFADDDGAVRLRLPRTSFDDYVGLAFDEIRHYARADRAATLRLLDTLAALAAVTRMPERRTPLWSQALAILEGARESIGVDADRDRIEHRFRTLARTLGHDPEPYLRGADAPA